MQCFLAEQNNHKTTIGASNWLSNLCNQCHGRWDGRPNLGPRVDTHTCGNNVRRPDKLWLQSLHALATGGGNYLGLGEEAPLLLDSKAHWGKVHCSRGPTQPQQSNVNSVAPGQRDFLLAAKDCGPFWCGPLHHTVQSPATNVCLTFPSPQGRGSQRHNRKLGAVESTLHIPTSSINSAALTQTSATQTDGHFDSSILDQPHLVPPSHRHLQCHHTSRGLQAPATTGGGHRIPSTARLLQASRLGFLKWLLRASASKTSAVTIASRQAASTLRQYESAFDKIKLYFRRCNYHTFNKARAFKFFIHLYDSGLSYKALLLHRSAVADILLLSWNIDVLGREFRQLFSTFCENRPIVKSPPPQWSLSLVLRHISSGPYTRGVPLSPQGTHESLFPNYAGSWNSDSWAHSATMGCNSHGNQCSSVSNHFSAFTQLSVQVA